MGIKRLTFVGLLGYGIYKLLGRRPSSDRAAFAPGEASGSGFRQIRNAGPASMASPTPHWDRVDQASDESFPASDAPGTY